MDDVSLLIADHAPEGSADARVGGRSVDLLILTALQDELEAVLAVGECGHAGWDERKDQRGFRCYRRGVDNGRGGLLQLAAAWTGEMGGRTAVVRTQQLIGEFDPECLAMCGICAGYREVVALGDVIVADQLYSYDEGKVVVSEGKPAEVSHSLRTFDLPARWKMDAAFLARELDLSGLSLSRPRSRAAQRRWLLSTLLAQEDAGGPAPESHPERKSRCPDWAALVRETQLTGLVALQRGKLSLTAVGREQAQNDQVLHVDGPPEDPPFQVHVGAIASGVAVQEDQLLFRRLRRLVRTTLAVEMEGAAIGDVAERFKKPLIVVKAVSDYADEEKDDSFRKFACRASAEVLMAFLLKYLDPAPAPRTPERRRETEPASAISTQDHNRAILDPLDHLTLALLAKEIMRKAAELDFMPHSETVAATVLVSAGGKSYRATISREASRDRTTRDKLLRAIARVEVFANPRPLGLWHQSIETEKTQLDEAARDLRSLVAHFIADRLTVDG